MKIEGVCYLTLETTSKFATDKYYVVNTKARNLLTGSCAIPLNLLSVNMQSKTHPLETSSKCEINLTTTKVRNLRCKLDLADFKMQQADNTPNHLRKLVQTYQQSPFTEKIGKLKDTCNQITHN